MFADVVFSTEGLVIITALLTALSGTVVYLHKYLVAQTNQERDTWKNIAMESTLIVEAFAAKRTAAEGRPPRRRLVDPVPEHSSPVKESQREVALMQGARAALVAARNELGIPPRTEAEQLPDLQEILEDWEGPEKVEQITLTGAILEVPDGANVTLAVPEGSVIIPKDKPNGP